MNILLKQAWLWSNMIVLVETISILFLFVVLAKRGGRDSSEKVGVDSTKDTIWSLADLYSADVKENINYKTPGSFETRK
ncbi:MAG: hypothetical protein AB7F64_01465 [Gammaproteobacteria bacterium]